MREMRVQRFDVSVNVDASTGHHEVVPVGRRSGEQPPVFGSGHDEGAVAVLYTAGARAVLRTAPADAREPVPEVDPSSILGWRIESKI